MTQAPTRGGPRAPLAAPSLDDIRRAHERIAGAVVRTPLIRLAIDLPGEIWLKLETLQPIGSFKLRGALNAIRALPPAAIRDGVWTASAGNMAQGVAWGARELGVPCTVLVPDTAARTKIAATRELGAEIVTVSYDEWWRTMMEHGRPGMRGTFIHPVADAAVIAGNATVGLEIAEDLPDADLVYVPYGGGGLSCGIASALRGVGAPARVIACEVETAAPLTASFGAGRASSIEPTPSWVSGIGGKSVLEEMWPLAREVIWATRALSLSAIEAALRTLVRRARVVSEGAGAAPLAAALADVRDADHASRVVCVISGGNIDASVLREILERD